ncbi:hypothetical protein SUDANB1_07101 [Streptomyces sp. enrichment culture]|uniref:hypothetical protein n=1 Tax=Streptomyces sp. enrichment culture TaxID=1795815 RepID=UPI003F555A4E
MSSLMPKTPPLVIEPLPQRVRDFAAKHMPKHVMEAECLMTFTRRELDRPVNPLSVEDMGDREDVIAEHRRADKVVSSNPERMGSYLRSLS